MTNRRHIRFRVVSTVAIAVIAGIGFLAAIAHQAQAQSGVIGPVDPNVTIDISVLEDGGVGAVTRPQRGLSFSTDISGDSLGNSFRTLMPNRRTPVSRLHIRPDGSSTGRMARTSGSKLRRPRVRSPKMTKPIRRPNLPSIVAPAKSMPAIKAPTIVAIAPPPPRRAPKSKPVVKRKSKPARAPVATKPIESAPPLPPLVVAKAIPPPPTAPKAKATPKPKQTASLPPKGGNIKAGKAVRVVFNPGVSKLPSQAKDGLRAVVAQIKGAATLRLQLLAYAGSSSMSSSKARRVSLSRALSVRSFLIESGVRSTRIDVRALGNKSPEKPINRVDVNVVER